MIPPQEPAQPAGPPPPAELSQEQPIPGGEVRDRLRTLEAEHHEIWLRIRSSDEYIRAAALEGAIGALRSLLKDQTTREALERAQEDGHGE